VEDLVMAARALRSLFGILGIGFFIFGSLPANSDEPVPHIDDPQADDNRGGPVSATDLSAVSPAALASLESLMADHPELLTLIKRDDEIWQWLDVHFTNHGNTVQWTHDQGVNFKHYIAMSSYTKPIIYLAPHTRSGQSISPQLQLSGLVYELLNISHEDEFKAVVALARAGKLTRDQFVVEMARIEFKTCHETKVFHDLVWLPYALKNHLSPIRGNWHLTIGDNFNRWLNYHRRVVKDGYPDDAYGPTYALLVAKPN
jgi:hypothetical protein